jgi:hypothetical protein
MSSQHWTPQNHLGWRCEFPWGLALSTHRAQPCCGHPGVRVAGLAAQGLPGSGSRQGCLGISYLELCRCLEVARSGLSIKNVQAVVGMALRPGTKCPNTGSWEQTSAEMLPMQEAPPAGVSQRPRQSGLCDEDSVWWVHLRQVCKWESSACLPVLWVQDLLHGRQCWEVGLHSAHWVSVGLTALAEDIG